MPGPGVGGGFAWVGGFSPTCFMCKKLICHKQFNWVYLVCKKYAYFIYTIDMPIDKTVILTLVALQLQTSVDSIHISVTWKRQIT